jgi:hypothetical protein
VSEPLNIDIPLVTRAVQNLTQIHAMPPIQRGVVGFDAIKQLLVARLEGRPARLDPTAYPCWRPTWRGYLRWTALDGSARGGMWGDPGGTAEVLDCFGALETASRRPPQKTEKGLIYLT